MMVERTYEGREPRLLAQVVGKSGCACSICAEGLVFSPHPNARDVWAHCGGRSIPLGALMWLERRPYETYLTVAGFATEDEEAAWRLK